jgi:phosphinothricin acetyltransferase
MNIRKATLDDAGAICSIFNYYVENTTIALETVPISEIEAKQRTNDTLNSGHLIYIGEKDNKIIGFYCTFPWNKYCSCKTTVEESIFLDKDEIGKGYGTQLFEHLLEQIDKTTTHVLIASITIQNEGSIRLHEKFGFKQISYMKEIGRKFDQWQDIGHWQLIFKENS